MRMGFKQYKKVMDLSSFKMNKTDDSTFKHNYQMLTLPQLNHSIDSIQQIEDGYVKKAVTGVNTYMKFPRYLDTTGWDKIEKDTAASKYLMPLAWATDSIHKAWTIARHSRDSVDKAQAKLQKTRDSVAAAVAEIAKAAAAKAAKAGSSKGNTPAGKGDVSTRVGAPATVSPGHPTAMAATNLPPMDIHPAIPGGGAMNRISDLREPPPTTLEDLIPDSARTAVLDHAITALNSAKISLDQPVLLFNNEQNNLRQHQIAWHEKITLAIAVLVMFLIGAPLGSIIRKGGIGLPLVFAVVFFVVFFLLNNFCKKFVKEDLLSPIGGMWMATYVLTPIGLFLTYKALQDSQLFNKEFFYRFPRRIKSLLRRAPAAPPQPAATPQV